MRSHAFSLKMGTSLARPTSVAWAVAFALATVPLAQAAPTGPGSPIGSQIVVVPPSKTRVSVQATAMDAQGDFVVAWENDDQASSTSGYDIYARRYAADGISLGSPFLVNTYTSGNQEHPAVAMDAQGDFVVAWESDDQASSTSGFDIYAERYASDGMPLGSSFLVNTYTSGNQEYPAVAMDAQGDFVVAWESYGQASSASGYDIYARRYASDGAPLGSPFLVNTYTGENQMLPAVAMDAQGDFVVAWESDNQASSTSGFDIYAERYTSDGAPLGSPFLVNTYTSGSQEYPAVAMDAQGDFVVAWESDNQVSSTSGYDIYAERYASDGAPLGSPFLVNTYTSGNQAVLPAVAMDAQGDFVVAWKAYSESLPPKTEIYAQRYTANGTAEGTNFLVPPLTPKASSAILNVVSQPSVAMDATGDFIVAEPGAYSTYNGSHKYYYSGIVAQRYQGELPPDVSVTGVSSENTVSLGSFFSVSFEVENRTTPAFETTDAYLNRFLGTVIDPTLTLNLPPNAASLILGGPNWSCGGGGAIPLSCTYTGVVSAGQNSPPLQVALVAPETPGTLEYGASVEGSSGPGFSGSVMVESSPKSGGGGGMGWLDLLGLLGLWFVSWRRRRQAVR